MAETRRKKRRKPSQAVRRRRQAGKRERREHRQEAAAKVVNKREDSGKVANKGGDSDPTSLTSISHDSSGGGSGRGGNDQDATSVRSIEGGAGVAGETAAARDRPGGVSPATAATVASDRYTRTQEFLAHEDAAPARTSTAQSAAYRRELRAHREHMQAVRAQIKVVKQASKENKAEQRKKLNELLSDPKRAVPEKPHDYLTKRQERQGERFFEVLAGDPSKITEKLLGRGRLKTLEKVGDAQMDLVQKKLVTQKYGPPSVRRTEPALGRYYRKAGPATRQRLRAAGLGPKKRHGTLLEAATFNSTRAQYRHQKRKNIAGRTPVFRDWKALTEQQQERQAVRAYKERTGAERLLPHERKIAEREGRAMVEREVDRSERALKLFGAFPAQGEKFVNALDDAIENGNAKQRTVANTWIQRLDHLDQEVLDSIDPGKGAYNRAVAATQPGPNDELVDLAQLFGLVDRKKGKLMMVTGEDYGNSRWKAIKEKSDQKKEEERHQYDLDVIVSNAWNNEFKPFFDPNTWRMIAEAGIEVTGQLPNIIGKKLAGVVPGVDIPESDTPKFDAMLEAFKNQDAPIGFVEKIMEGEGLDTAFEEFKSRAAESPLGTIGEGAAAFRLGRIGALKARYGTAGKSVDVARPAYSVLDRIKHENWSTMSAPERLKAIFERRGEARDAAKARALAAKKEAARINAEQKAAAKAGGKKKQPVTASDVLTATKKADEGETTQFYSAATPVRTFQKGREIFQAVTGRDPFNKSGRRVTGYFDSRVGGEFRRGANRVVPRMKASNLRMSAEVETQINKLMYRPARAYGLFKTRQLDLQAFLLRYDGSVKAGTEAEDLDRAIATNQEYLDSGDVPEGSTQTLDEVHTQARENIQVLEALKDDLKLGPEAALHRNDLAGRVEKLQETGRSIDDALVDEGFVKRSVSARRRAIAREVRQRTVGRIKKGEPMPGEEAKRVTAQNEMDIARAVKVEKKAKDAAYEEARRTRKRKRPPEEPRRATKEDVQRDREERARREGKEPEVRPEEPPEFTSTVGAGPASAAGVRSRGGASTKAVVGETLKPFGDRMRELARDPKKAAFLNEARTLYRELSEAAHKPVGKRAAAFRAVVDGQRKRSAAAEAAGSKDALDMRRLRDAALRYSTELERKLSAGETKAEASPAKPKQARPPEPKPTGPNVSRSAAAVMRNKAQYWAARIMVRGGRKDAFWFGMGKSVRLLIENQGSGKERQIGPEPWSLKGQAKVDAYNRLLAEMPGLRDRAPEVPGAGEGRKRWVEAEKEIRRLRDQAQAEVDAARASEARAEPKEPKEPETHEEFKAEAGEHTASIDWIERQATMASEEMKLAEQLGDGARYEAARAELQKFSRMADRARELEHEAVRGQRRTERPRTEDDTRGESAANEAWAEAVEHLERVRAKQEEHLKTATDPVAVTLKGLREQEAAYRRFLDRQRKGMNAQEGELAGRPDVTPNTERKGGKPQTEYQRDLGKRLRESHVGDIVARFTPLLDKPETPLPDKGVSVPTRASPAAEKALRVLRGVVREEGVPESDGDFAFYRLQLRDAHDKLGGMVYKPNAVARLTEAWASWRVRAWSHRGPFEELDADQKAILHGMGVGVPGRRMPMTRGTLEALASALKLSESELHLVIHSADIDAVARTMVKAIEDARDLIERRAAHGQQPHGEALDEFHEETFEQGATQGDAEARDFEEALGELMAAHDLFEPAAFRTAIEAVIEKFRRRGVGAVVFSPGVKARRQYLAERVQQVGRQMIAERAADFTHEDAGVSNAETSLAQIRARRKLVNQRIYQLLKSPMDVASHDGWVWLEGPKLGQYFNERVGGGFLKYDAAQERYSRGQRRMSLEHAGELSTPESIALSDLTQKNVVRESFRAQMRLQGIMRMKTALMALSPYRRVMEQDEAQVLIDDVARRGGGRFVMVPMRRGGDLDDAAADELLEGVQRAPKPGEPVLVVPAGIVRVFNEVVRPPGRVRSVATYLSQKYVQATLPFSVLWHAGNVVDLITRLAVAGVNPFRDRELARVFRSRMIAEDPINGPEMFDYLVGHMGSRESVIRTATLGQALAGGKSELANKLVALLDKLNQHRGVKLLQPLRYSSQRLFDLATLSENFFVEHAMGSVLRSMGRDLGYEMSDHLALAEKMLDEVHLNPDLMEDFGQRTLSIVGDYTSSAFGQNVLQAIDPFWSWVRESARFVFFTFPAKHPIKFALALTLANAQEDVAERFGLNDYLDGTLADLPEFLQGAFPVGSSPLAVGGSLLGAEASDGWFRPTSPFTSWGETSKMLDDPLGYLAGRPLPYLERTLSVARGHRSYNAIGQYALRNFQSWAGIDLPGFDPPQTLPITEYTGNRTLGVLGELVKAFVPGANQVDEVLRRGTLGTQEHNIFQPDPIGAAAIDDWWESRVINPLGKVRDLSAIGHKLSPQEELARYGPPSLAEQRAAHEPKPHREANMEQRPDLGATMYTDRGNVLEWNGNRWVKGRPEGDTRVKPSQVKSKGTSKNVSKPSKERRKKAVAALSKAHPELLQSDPKAVDAIADAARKYDVPPEVLASIYENESAFGTNPAITEPHDGDVLGPMQFQQATWDAYGVDGDGDGNADIQSNVDAIHSAANYLKANGGDTDEGLYDAIFAYNHADWYVQDILADADKFKSSKWIDAGVGRTVALPAEERDKVKKIAGSWGGSRRQAMRAIPAHATILTGETAREAARHDKRTPTENDDVGGSPTSDHLTTNTLSYAADMPGVMGDGHADELAKQIAENLGMESWHGTNEVVKDGYRYQLIWQDEGHYDHVHLGVMWVGDSQPPTGTYAGGPVASTATVAPSSSGAGYTVTGPSGAALPSAPVALHPGQQVVTGNPAIGTKLRHRWRRFEVERMQLVMQLLNDDIDEVEFATGLQRASGMAGL